MTESFERARRLRVGAYAVCLDEEVRILLCRIRPGWTVNYDGYWTLPGGGLDHGEDPRDAALRELREETGLEGEILALLDVESNHSHFVARNGAEVDFHGVRVIYRVRAGAQELCVEAEGSTDACGWFTRDELAGMPLVDLVEHAVGLVFGEA